MRQNRTGNAGVTYPQQETRHRETAGHSWSLQSHRRPGRQKGGRRHRTAPQPRPSLTSGKGNCVDARGGPRPTDPGPPSSPAAGPRPPDARHRDRPPVLICPRPNPATRERTPASPTGEARTLARRSLHFANGTFGAPRRRPFCVWLGDLLATRALDVARDEQRIVISGDTDFGALLALTRQKSPSVILFRRRHHRTAEQQIVVILAHLNDLADDLTTGAQPRSPTNASASGDCHYSTTNDRHHAHFDDRDRAGRATRPRR